MRDHNPVKISWQFFLLDLLECIAVFAFSVAVLPRFSGGVTMVPDFLFLILAYKAITRRQSTVLIITFVCALCSDALNPSMLLGTHVIVKLPVLLAINFTRRTIPRDKKFLPFLFIIVAGIFVHNILFALVLALKGVHSVSALLGIGLLAALYTSLFALIMLGLHALIKGGFNERYSC